MLTVSTSGAAGLEAVVTGGVVVSLLMTIAPDCAVLSMFMPIVAAGGLGCSVVEPIALSDMVMAECARSGIAAVVASDCVSMIEDTPSMMIVPGWATEIVCPFVVSPGL